jgi:hypothetical protein
VLRDCYILWFAIDRGGPQTQICENEVHSRIHRRAAGLARRNTDGWGTDDPNAVAYLVACSRRQVSEGYVVFMTGVAYPGRR